MSLLLTANKIHKSFNGQTVVDQISFSVERGKVMGVLGPNGAGKTTIIRMIMGVFAPDSGSIEVSENDCPDNELDMRQVGYLPEERGLYQDARVIDLLVFLATLKGLEKKTARSKAMDWLAKWDLADNAESKVEQLSKGMKQKVQFIASIIHDPELMILDEPLSGLDPVNQDLFKAEIQGFVKKKKTILLSSHQMSLVEETCDNILLIDKGKKIIYGKLKEIKEKYGKYQVQVNALSGAERIAELPLVEKSQQSFGHWTYFLKQGVSPADFLHQLPLDIPYQELSIKITSLHDIFVETVKGGDCR